MVVLADGAGRTLTTDGWAKALRELRTLLLGSGQTLKLQGDSGVVVRTIRLEGQDIEVVVKWHLPSGFFRSVPRARAIRNLKTALRLQGCGIAVVGPLAALERRIGPFTTASIYISEYVTGSETLYSFATKTLPSLDVERTSVKGQLCRQIGSIFAKLDKSGLWHRDAKASNFLVRRDGGGGYEVVLVDMDGIKRYVVRRKARQFRCLWHLAASLMDVETVRPGDYLRTFVMYCELAGIPREKRRDVLRFVKKKAEAKHKRNRARAG